MSDVSKAQLSSAIRQHHIDWGRGTVTDGGGSPVTLRRQALAVLKELAGKPGEVVTKDELMEAVWPNIAVTDDSLVQCITEIRKALGDDEHLIIKTVPKRGYVLEAGKAPAALAPTKRKFAAIGATALAALAALALWFWTARPAASPFPSPGVAVLPFKNISGNPGWDKLAEGLTEDATTDLSKYPHLRVIARNSTEAYRSGNVDMRAAGRRSACRILLKGVCSRMMARCASRRSLSTRKPEPISGHSGGTARM